MTDKWHRIDDPDNLPPKDGTPCIVLIDEFVIEATWIDRPWGGYWDVVNLPSHGCGCCSTSNADPTHWMPFPEPPEAPND